MALKHPSFSRKHSYKKSARSRISHPHRSVASKKPPNVLPLDHESETKQVESQEPGDLRSPLIGCVPSNTSECVFVLFVLIYLVCAIIHFAHTGDIGMFTTLLPYMAAYVGIPMVTPHLPWDKKK